VSPFLPVFGAGTSKVAAASRSHIVYNRTLFNEGIGSLDCVQFLQWPWVPWLALFLSGRGFAISLICSH
jgi:hypothetical protein